MGRLKRYHPPGTSPGTLPETGIKGQVELITYGSQGVRRAQGLTVAQALSLPRERAWLRVKGLDTEIVAELGRQLNVHPLVLEDILNPGQRPKMELHPHFLFLVVDVPLLSGSTLQEVQVSLLLFRDLVVSVEEREHAFFVGVEKRLGLGFGRLFQYGSDYLAYALVDAAVDHFFPVVESLGEQLEELEEILLAQQDQVLPQLHTLRRHLLRLRRSLWPLRDAVGNLLRQEAELVGDGVRVFFRDVHDHTLYLLDLVENYRDMAGSLVELSLSMVAQRTNEVMKVLTVIGTIFLPLTFIVGVYGMNFEHMPELAWPWAYPALWGIMVLLGLGMLRAFRRRGWL
ncbi:MAG: magnesium/cobalt transporter CorA [Thermoanaerobaculum sp.]|nr:magnesium/cobalt transporter CorA [Thermoanaerobaculum sp.]